MHTATWGKFASGMESLLVYGGVDQTGKALADFWHVDLVNRYLQYNDKEPEVYPAMFITLRDVQDISVTDPNDVVADLKNILLAYAGNLDLYFKERWGEGYYDEYDTKYASQLAELDLLKVYYVKESNKWVIQGRQFWQYVCRHFDGDTLFEQWCNYDSECPDGSFCDFHRSEWGDISGSCQRCQDCQSEGKSCSQCGLEDLGAEACNDKCALPPGEACGDACSMWAESISSIRRFKTEVFARSRIESCNIDHSVFDIALGQTKYNDTVSCNRSHVGNKCMRGMCIEKNKDDSPLYCYDNNALTPNGGIVKPCYDNTGLMVTRGTCTLPGPRHGHSATSFYIQGTIVYSIFGGESTHLMEAQKSFLINDVHIAFFEGATISKGDKLICQGACEGSATWSKLRTTCDDNERSGPSCPEKRRDAAVSVMSNNGGNNGRLLIFGGMGGASEDTKSHLYYKLGMKSYLDKQVETRNFKAFDDLWYV